MYKHNECNGKLVSIPIVWSYRFLKIFFKKTQNFTSRSLFSKQSSRYLLQKAHIINLMAYCIPVLLAGRGSLSLASAGSPSGRGARPSSSSSSTRIGRLCFLLDIFSKYRTFSAFSLDNFEFTLLHKKYN